MKENIHQLVIDYIDEELSFSDSVVAKQRINDKEAYKQLEQEYREIFRAIEDDVRYQPPPNLRDGFQKMLLRENSNNGHAIGTSPHKVVQVPLKILHRIAAVIVLMIGSYWYGDYSRKQTYLTSLADLKVQQQQLKTMAALSLFESESASKRIQGVAISMKLEQPDPKVINALINEMTYDELVNVRLASARALEKFSHLTKVREAFIEALKTEENDTMQIELIEILSHLKEKRAIPRIKEILRDENTPVFMKNQVEEELQNLI